MNAPQGGLPNPLVLPDDLREALESVVQMTARSSRDWAATSEDAWLYAIVHGWDCCERPDGGHDDGCDGQDPLTAPGGLAERYGWGPAHVSALRRYHWAVAEATGQVDVRFKAAVTLAHYASMDGGSPRYEGADGVRKLLDEPGTVEHAYKSAQRANPFGGADFLAEITAARNLLGPTTPRSAR